MDFSLLLDVKTDEPAGNHIQEGKVWLVFIQQDTISHAYDLQGKVQMNELTDKVYAVEADGNKISLDILGSDAEWFFYIKDNSKLQDMGIQSNPWFLFLENGTVKYSNNSIPEIPFDSQTSSKQLQFSRQSNSVSPLKEIVTTHIDENYPEAEELEPIKAFSNGTNHTNLRAKPTEKRDSHKINIASGSEQTGKLSKDIINIEKKIRHKISDSRLKPKAKEGDFVSERGSPDNFTTNKDRPKWNGQSKRELLPKEKEIPRNIQNNQSQEYKNVLQNDDSPKHEENEVLKSENSEKEGGIRDSKNKDLEYEAKEETNDIEDDDKDNPDRYKQEKKDLRNKDSRSFSRSSITSQVKASSINTPKKLKQFPMFEEASLEYFKWGKALQNCQDEIHFLKQKIKKQDTEIRNLQKSVEHQRIFPAISVPRFQNQIPPVNNDSEFWKYREEKDISFFDLARKSKLWITTTEKLPNVRKFRALSKANTPLKYSFKLRR